MGTNAEWMDRNAKASQTLASAIDQAIKAEFQKSEYTGLPKMVLMLDALGNLIRSFAVNTIHGMGEQKKK